ncbi:MAG: HAMP domain-containing sensor histidine kinase [Candidatus Paceibacterota bacterium]|jgi:signal transduction histidine kinase
MKTKSNNIKENLFTSTRFKLDIIASLFVFAILSIFSYTIYRLLTLDLIYQISPVFKNSGVANYINADKLFSDFREQTIFLLIVLDVVVFVLSVFFFDRLVKKMLAPIEYLSNVQKRFAENVSHELRTPLSIMNMHSEILLDKLEKNKNSFSDKNLLNNIENGVSSIDSEIKGIVTLIDDLLFEARVKYSEDKVENISIAQIKYLLEKVIKNLSNNKDENVRLILEDNFNEKDLDKKIKVNKLHLERIFTNLISNSFKFTKQGEVKIVLEKYKSNFSYKLKFSVEDSGIGIRKKDLSKVSERFFRGENVEGEISGTGIGLAIVSDLVKSYGWSIKIKSEEMVGTKVEIGKISLI